MTPRINRQVLLKSRPTDIPHSEHFEVVERPVTGPDDKEVLVRNIYLSVEPAMRGWVSSVANYSEPVAIGAVMRSLAVGRVEESRHPDYQPGEFVFGFFGWQDYATVDGGTIQRRLDQGGLPPSTALGVVGLNGLTAYFGLLETGQPKAGETVVVSTAAGAVGSCVGQIAKIQGCRTVGIAGGAEKITLAYFQPGHFIPGYNEALLWSGGKHSRPTPGGYSVNDKRIRIPRYHRTHQGLVSHRGRMVGAACRGRGQRRWMGSLPEPKQIGLERKAVQQQIMRWQFA